MFNTRKQLDVAKGNFKTEQTPETRLNLNIAMLNHSKIIREAANKAKNIRVLENQLRGLEKDLKAAIIATEEMIKVIEPLDETVEKKFNEVKPKKRGKIKKKVT